MKKRTGYFIIRLTETNEYVLKRTINGTVEKRNVSFPVNKNECQDIVHEDASIEFIEVMRVLYKNEYSTENLEIITVYFNKNDTLVRLS